MELYDHERPFLMGGLVFGVACSLGALAWQLLLGFDFTVLLCICISTFLSGAICGPAMVRKIRRGGFVFGVGPTFLAGILLFVFLSVWQTVWYDQSRLLIRLTFDRSAKADFITQAFSVGFATMICALPFGVAAGATITRWVETKIELQRINSLPDYDEGNQPNDLIVLNPEG